MDNRPACTYDKTKKFVQNNCVLIAVIHLRTLDIRNLEIVFSLSDQNHKDESTSLNNSWNNKYTLLQNLKKYCYIQLLRRQLWCNSYHHMKYT